MGWQDFPHAGNPNGLGTYIPVLHLHHKFLEKNYPLRLQIAQAYEEHKDGAGFGVHMPFTLPEHAYTSVTVREVGEGHSPANPSDWSYTGEVIQLGDYDKVAYLVLGPESSGTRMLTEGIIRGGVWGQAGHNQQIDRKADFADLPEKIVYRKSLPHGKKWPDLVKITKRMLSAGYKVVPVFIQRDPKYAVKSQVRSSHVKSEAEGTANIKRAFDEISHLAMNAPVQVIYVHYGAFVEQEHIRRKLFEMLNLDYPETMLWYNANKRYEDGS